MNREPFTQTPDPDLERRMAEKRELMRIAAQRAIDMADTGFPVEAEYLNWCRQFVALNKPLGRPLSTGEPA